MECFTTSFRFAYLELWREREERVCVWEKEKGYTYLPFLFGAFLFFSFVDCIPVFSLSLSLLHLHLHLYLYSFLEKGRQFYLVDLSYSCLLT